MKSVMRGIFFSGAGLCLRVTILLVMTLLPVGSFATPAEPEQQSFSSPDEARQALIAAVKAKDQRAMKAIFGPVLRELEPGDPVEQAAEFDHFARHVQEGVELVKQGEEKADSGYRHRKMAVSRADRQKGRLLDFDTEAGREEILNRRIGHNELLAINVCRAYVEAQREYYNDAGT